MAFALTGLIVGSVASVLLSSPALAVCADVEEEAVGVEVEVADVWRLAVALARARPKSGLAVLAFGLSRGAAEGACADLGGLVEGEEGVDSSSLVARPPMRDKRDATGLSSF